MAQGKAKRKTFYAAHCEKHGRKSMKDIVSWVAVGHPKNKEKFKFIVELINKDSKLPHRANKDDAGLDVFSIEDYNLMPGQSKFFNLGFRGEFSKGYVCDIRSKSGRALKEGLIVLNQPATIDSGYRGIYGVILHNSNADKTII